MSDRQNERDIACQLTGRTNDFLLEMKKGFAHVGRQYHLTVDGDDYYIDLLTYHTRLHCQLAEYKESRRDDYPQMDLHKFCLPKFGGQEEKRTAAPCKRAFAAKPPTGWCAA